MAALPQFRTEFRCGYGPISPRESSVFGTALARGEGYPGPLISAESPHAARQRAAHFQWLRQNPALYREFLNRAGGVPAEQR